MIRSHELARELLALPDGPVTVSYPTSFADDEIPPSEVTGLSSVTYSGETAVELVVG